MINPKYKLSKSTIAVFSIVLCLCAHVMADESKSETIHDKIKFGVGGYFDGGRFQLTDPVSSTSNGEFLNRTGARWNITGQISDNAEALVNIHWLWWRNLHTDIGLFHITGNKFATDLEAALKINWGEAHKLKLGVFEYKYNPQSKNLGEYILRSETNPLFLETGQGRDILRESHTRVSGALYENKISFLDNALLIYFEQTNMPVNDLSAALLTGVSNDMFGVQTGLAWRRMVKWGKEPNRRDPSPDVVTATESHNSFVYDTLNLTRTNFTYMLRGNFDPLEDMSLYAEAAILGFKNDTAYYTKISERIPIMVGLKVPTMGVFDELGFEVEYFNHPYLDRKYLLADGSASDYNPGPPLYDFDPANLPSYNRDDTKWTVYLNRSLNKWVKFHLRFANDHLRLLGYDQEIENEQRPLTYTGKDWYFLARVEFHN